MQVILASMSPRRQELLARLGIPFTIRPAHVPEEELQAAFTGPAEDVAVYLARHKAAAVAALARSEAPEEQQFILASDTTVILDGELLGKPQDAAEARAMLTRLRDRPHVVRTGVVVRAALTGQEWSAALTTPVQMRDYSDDEIAAYIATGDPFDKAGGYAIQHAGFHPVARITGCATNVIGLPLCRVALLFSLIGLRERVESPDGMTHRCPWDKRCFPTSETVPAEPL